ncbi:hypothetical protein [Leptolyngbya sp. CCY15150]|uniref:hypothetical protein n=1 Tax=Leptolyngbya sp. CCY15150 TaxID=2767772 RepID=UPI00194FE8C9|nr:hypothetical protein [Leptolyngbya sp. CCY15150]
MINNLSHALSGSVAGKFLCILAIMLPVLGVVLIASAQSDEPVTEKRQSDPIIPPPAYVASSLL